MKNWYTDRKWLPLLILALFLLSLLSGSSNGLKKESEITSFYPTRWLVSTSSIYRTAGTLLESRRLDKWGFFMAATTTCAVLLVHVAAGYVSIHTFPNCTFFFIFAVLLFFALLFSGRSVICMKLDSSRGLFDGNGPK